MTIDPESAGGPARADVAGLAARAHALAGDRGIPEALQALADRWPESASAPELYAVSSRLSLAIGDLAAALEAAGRRTNASQGQPDSTRRHLGTAEGAGPIDDPGAGGQRLGDG
ncbi:MAG: hypothetical protein IPI32_04625 [Austwickia sp.]|jgi:hypothetical protein|nr:hypothetical protein [Austwickia sp.]MBK8436915.1 hypothetical protein [Austwickia sp.]MBK9100542.1 hypothetical protein [Austwickia sp.]